MEANVSRGYLEVHDEKGYYKIPVGRRSRKCLMILDQKEGEYIRSLELDLFTGFVYYCVDNETSGGLSYYYDMSSKKVSRYFIHRYLRLARNHGFVATPEEYEVFEKLPCANWAEEMKKLPGWEEAIENRVTRLLLPGRDVVRIPVRELLRAGDNSGADIASAKNVETSEAENGVSGKNSETAEAESGVSGKDSESIEVKGGISEIEAVSFFRAPSAYPARVKEYPYLFVEKDDKTVLLQRDDTVGSEFFGEDAEFERILLDTESAWIASLAQSVTSADPSISTPVLAATEGVFTPDVMRTIFPQGEELVLQKVIIRFKGGKDVEIDSDADGQLRRAGILQTALRGLLWREIELV